MKRMKKDEIKMPESRRKMAKPVSRKTSFGVLALCLAAMGFVVKKGVELDRKEAEAELKADADIDDEEK